jgi:hypothetical protein
LSKLKNKRTFRGQVEKLDSIIEQHNFLDDFDNTQDVDATQFLQENLKFKLAGQINKNMTVKWSDSFDNKVKDVLYIVVINNKIVKYGMTETSIHDRHTSLLSGLEKYSKTNKNSETNRRSYKLISRAVSSEQKAEYYCAQLQVENITYCSVIGDELCVDNVAPTRQEERRLYNAIVSRTNGIQPILNVQVPGGR